MSEYGSVAANAANDVAPLSRAFVGGRKLTVERGGLGSAEPPRAEGVSGMIPGDHQDDGDDDALSGEYVLGTLDAEDRAPCRDPVAERRRAGGAGRVLGALAVSSARRHPAGAPCRRPVGPDRAKPGRDRERALARARAQREDGLDGAPGAGSGTTRPSGAPRPRSRSPPPSCSR